jgi:tripartite-type tricarboxylate transporter receptor subunit TctC
MKDSITASTAAGSLRRRTFVLAASALAVGSARAQDAWSPTHPIRLVVTYPPGGGADVMARAMSDKLGQKLGQPVIVENRGGAGGLVGTEVVFNAAPDGYTILWGTSDTMAMAPHLYKKLPYKPTEFTPIVPVVGLGFVMVGRADLEAKTFPELVALAKKKELTFASWGNGSPGHVGAEMLKTLAGLPSVLIVPYQGTAPGSQALLAGQVDAMFLPTPLWLAFNQRVTTFAIAAPKRYERLKDVPTMEEFGIPVNMDVWQGLFAPPKTPRAVVERIHAATSEVVKDAEVKKKFDELGGFSMSASNEEFTKFISADNARWGEVMRTAQVKPQG